MRQKLVSPGGYPLITSLEILEKAEKIYSSIKPGATYFEIYCRAKKNTSSQEEFNLVMGCLRVTYLETKRGH